MKITKINSYTIPLYGNKHIFPYGYITVEDDNGEKKVVKFGELNHPWNSFCFKRKRYYFNNVGNFLSPHLVVRNNNN